MLGVGILLGLLALGAATLAIGAISWLAWTIAGRAGAVVVGGICTSWCVYEVAALFHEDVPTLNKWINWPAAGIHQVERWHNRLVDNGYRGRDCLLSGMSFMEFGADPAVRRCLFDLEVLEVARWDEDVVRLVARCETSDWIVERRLLSLRYPDRDSYMPDCGIAVFHGDEDRGVGQHTLFPR